MLRLSLSDIKIELQELYGADKFDQPKIDEHNLTQVKTLQGRPLEQCYLSQFFDCT